MSYACCTIRLARILFLFTLLGGAVGAIAVPAHAGVSGEFPYIVVCSVEDPIDVQPWDELVFYVSARLENGGILYKSLTSNPVLVTISADGVVTADNLKNCDGKTVAELRAAGRAYNFSQTQ
ncbi:MAG: hypothetical protein AAGJ86_04710 [Pseudomonadota bacterium]